MEQLRKQNTYQGNLNSNNNMNNMNNIYNSNNFNQTTMSNHFNNINNLNNKPQNLMEKIAELEKSRGLNQNERPPTPDFLKSEVGNKNNINNNSYSKSNKSNGFKAFNSDSNVVNVNFGKSTFKWQ